MTLPPIETTFLTPWLLSQLLNFSVTIHLFLLIHTPGTYFVISTNSFSCKIHFRHPRSQQPPILVKELPMPWTILSPMNSNPLTLPFSSYLPAPHLHPSPYLRVKSHHHHHSSNPLKIPGPLPSKMPIYNLREPIIHILCTCIEGTTK